MGAANSVGAYDSRGAYKSPNSRKNFIQNAIQGPMAYFIQLQLGDNYDLSNEEAQDGIDEILRSESSKPVNPSDPSNLALTIVMKIKFRKKPERTRLQYLVGPTIVNIGANDERWQVIILVHDYSSTSTQLLNFSVIARIEDNWSSVMRFDSRSSASASESWLNKFKSMIARERALQKRCIELEKRLDSNARDLENTLASIDRDGSLSTVHHLAMRRAEAILRPKSSASIFEIAKRNGDSKLITAVTSHNLLCDSKNHLESGRKFIPLTVSDRLHQGLQKSRKRPIVHTRYHCEEGSFCHYGSLDN
jgi:hypothetical protein